MVGFYIRSTGMVIRTEFQIYLFCTLILSDYIVFYCMDIFRFIFTFPSGSVIKNLLPMQEVWVRSLGREDPLEKEMATHSSILAWEIP